MESFPEFPSRSSGYDVSIYQPCRPVAEILDRGLAGRVWARGELYPQRMHYQVDIADLGIEPAHQPREYPFASPAGCGEIMNVSERCGAARGLFTGVERLVDQLGLLKPIVIGEGKVNQGVRDGRSCGDPVEPAAQAHQRTSGPEDIPNPIRQPSPAAQRPRVRQVGDRLLHQRP
jgi:hypothetical protein